MRRRWYLPPNDRKLFNEGMIVRPPSPPVAPSSYHTGYTSSANRMAYGRGNGQRERLTRGNTISSPSILTFTSFDPSVSLGRYSTTGRSYYTRSEGIPEEPIPESVSQQLTNSTQIVGDPTNLLNNPVCPICYRSVFLGRRWEFYSGAKSGEDHPKCKRSNGDGARSCRCWTGATSASHRTATAY